MSESNNVNIHTLLSQKQTPQDIHAQMDPQPQSAAGRYQAAPKLKNKVALITGGDSGIGKAIAIKFAQEGANVAIVYVSEDDRDAQETKRVVESKEQQCLLLPGDVGNESFCQRAVEEIIEEFGTLDILINNAAEQHHCEKLEEITSEQLERTFRTNIFGYFFMAKAALPHLKTGSSILNTTSVTAYAGSPDLIDYASTKGAIVAFTRSLSVNLAERGIRVNAVAPGPILTPLVTSSLPSHQVKDFGCDTPMKRPGQPEEVANCFVFLASRDSAYITGQVLHPNGGKIVNG